MLSTLSIFLVIFAVITWILVINQQGIIKFAPNYISKTPIKVTPTESIKYNWDIQKDNSNAIYVVKSGAMYVVYSPSWNDFYIPKSGNQKNLTVGEFMSMDKNEVFSKISNIEEKYILITLAEEESINLTSLKISNNKLYASAIIEELDETREEMYSSIYVLDMSKNISKEIIKSYVISKSNPEYYSTGKVMTLTQVLGNKYIIIKDHQCYGCDATTFTYSIFNTANGLYKELTSINGFYELEFNLDNNKIWYNDVTILGVRSECVSEDCSIYEFQDKQIYITLDDIQQDNEFEFPIIYKYIKKEQAKTYPIADTPDYSKDITSQKITALNESTTLELKGRCSYVQFSSFKQMPYEENPCTITNSNGEAIFEFKYLCAYFSNKPVNQLCKLPDATLVFGRRSNEIQYLYDLDISDDSYSVRTYELDLSNSKILFNPELSTSGTRNGIWAAHTCSISSYCDLEKIDTPTCRDFTNPESHRPECYSDTDTYWHMVRDRFDDPNQHTLSEAEESVIKKITKFYKLEKDFNFIYYASSQKLNLDCLKESSIEVEMSCDPEKSVRKKITECTDPQVLASYQIGCFNSFYSGNSFGEFDQISYSPAYASLTKHIFYAE